jgi:hypothetical protein
MIARAIKDEIVALTEGDSPHRRYRRYACFSDDEGQQLHAAKVQDDSSGAAQGAVAQDAAAMQPQQSSATVHKSPSLQELADWIEYGACGAEPAEAMLEERSSMMNLDNGVSSPGAKAGSDTSMLSCSSSDDGHEVDSAGVQTALVGRKRSCSKLNPPKEEDRTLPLKKLFENLSDLTGVDDAPGGLLSNGSSTSVYAATSGAPKAASVAGDLPHLDLQIEVGSLAAPVHKFGSLSDSQNPDIRGLLQARNSARLSPVRQTDSPLSSPLPSPAPLGRTSWASGGSSSVHNGTAFGARGMLLHNLSQVGVTDVHSACCPAYGLGAALKLCSHELILLL